MSNLHPPRRARPRPCRPAAGALGAGREVRRPRDPVSTARRAASQAVDQGPRDGRGEGGDRAVRASTDSGESLGDILGAALKAPAREEVRPSRRPRRGGASPPTARKPARATPPPRVFSYPGRPRAASGERVTRPPLLPGRSAGAGGDGAPVRGPPAVIASAKPQLARSRTAGRRRAILAQRSSRRSVPSRTAGRRGRGTNSGCARAIMSGSTPAPSPAPIAATTLARSSTTRGDAARLRPAVHQHVVRGGCALPCGAPQSTSGGSGGASSGGIERGRERRQPAHGEAPLLRRAATGGSRSRRRRRRPPSARTSRCQRRP